MKFSIYGSRGLVSFVLLLAIVLMSNQIAFSQLVCQPSGSPAVTTGAIKSTDPTQSGRVFRNGVPTSCFGGAPTQAPLAGTYHANQFTFNSPVTGCATLDFDFTGCGGNTTQINAYSTYNPASVGAGVIGTSGFSSTGTGSLSFPVTAGQPFTIVVNEVQANAGCASYSFTISYSTGCRQSGFDRNNDGKADYTVWRPSNGYWYTYDSTGVFTGVQFGQTGDITTAGDYTGDGKTDVSVYRPGNNTWYYGLSQTTPSTNFAAQQFGVAGDIPVPGDYDRDGKTDIAVWRPSNGFWYVLRSSSNTLESVQWGQNGDIPVTGDFDGDRINDFALVRPSGTTSGTYQWLILESNFNYGFYVATDFGFNTDKLVPGDYDGDGKTDIAVWRPSNGTWYYLKSSSSFSASTEGIFPFGQNGDIPQPADYDGDRVTDFAVYRPGATQGTFYVNNSQSNTTTGVAFGAPTDQPATSPYKVQ